MKFVRDLRIDKYHDNHLPNGMHIQINMYKQIFVMCDFSCSCVPGIFRDRIGFCRKSAGGQPGYVDEA